MIQETGKTEYELPESTAKHHTSLIKRTNGKLRQLEDRSRARDIRWVKTVLNSPQFYPETANERSGMWLSAGKKHPKYRENKEKKGVKEGRAGKFAKGAIAQKPNRID